MILDDAALGSLEPGEYTEETKQGHRFCISATHKTASHSGRRLYTVYCVTCKLAVSDQTTGPLQMVEMHLRLWEPSAAPSMGADAVPRDLCGADPTRQPSLENSLQDVARAVARGSGGISLSAGGSIVLADWNGGALASGKIAVPSPFATLAIGGAVRSVEVDGGVIMATPLDREQVRRLRTMCDQVLNDSPDFLERISSLKSQVDALTPVYEEAKKLVAEMAKPPANGVARTWAEEDYGEFLTRIATAVTSGTGAHPELGIPGFARIGRVDAVGRRSLWMRCFTEGDIDTIELRAGREGEDARVLIPNTNPLADDLHAVLLTARFAADWEDPRGEAHDLEAYGGSVALLAVADTGVALIQANGQDPYENRDPVAWSAHVDALRALKVPP